MASVLSDEALLLRAQKGQIGAFESLIKRHQGMIRGMLHNLTRESHSGEELAQQTFVTAWEKLQQCSSGNFKSWLGSIAWRQFLMWQRSRRQHPHVSIESDTQGDDFSHENEEYCRDPDISAPMDLHRALGELNKNQREALVLTALVGMTQAEVAALLAIPAGTVKSHIRRGMQNLRQLLEEN